MDLDAQRLMVRQFYVEHEQNLSKMVWVGKGDRFALPFEEEGNNP